MWDSAYGSLWTLSFSPNSMSVQFYKEKEMARSPTHTHSPHTPTHTGGEGSTVLTLPAFRAHALSTTLASKGGCFQPRPLLLLWGEGEQGTAGERGRVEGDYSIPTMFTAQKLFVGLYFFS